MAAEVEFETWGQVRGYLAENYPRVSIARIAERFDESRQVMSWRVNDELSAPNAAFTQRLFEVLAEMREAEAVA